jgi:hypothetical protein
MMSEEDRVTPRAVCHLWQHIVDSLCVRGVDPRELVAGRGYISAMLFLTRRDFRPKRMPWSPQSVLDMAAQSLHQGLIKCVFHQFPTVRPRGVFAKLVENVPASEEKAQCILLFLRGYGSIYLLSDFFVYPIRVAAKCNSVELAQYIIDNSDRDPQELFNATDIHTAAQFKNVDMAKLILSLNQEYQCPFWHWRGVYDASPEIGALYAARLSAIDALQVYNQPGCEAVSAIVAPRVEAYLAEQECIRIKRERDAAIFKTVCDTITNNIRGLYGDEPRIEFQIDVGVVDQIDWTQPWNYNMRTPSVLTPAEFLMMRKVIGGATLKTEFVICVTQVYNVQTGRDWPSALDRLSALDESQVQN